MDTATMSGAVEVEALGGFRTVAQLVEAQVERTPRAPALIGLQGETLTYEDLNHRANALAHQLRFLEAGPETLVGVCLERSVEMAVAVLAILKAGAAYVPLDPTYPRERLRVMMEDCRAPIILTQEKLVSALPPSGARRICLDTPAAWANRRPENLSVGATPDNLAYVIYTSGSTGKPKGVAMRHEPLINLLQWQLENWSFPGAARTLQFTSLNFDVSFQELFATWASGSPLVLVADDVRRDPLSLLRFLRAQRIQRLFLPFIALKRLAEAALAERTLPEDLREVITAGEQLRVTSALAEFFSRLQSCTLENQYGPSETHVITSYRLSGPPGGWPNLPSIGRPIANTIVRILDIEMNPVPEGAQGELYLGGVCLARGYLGRSDLTEGRFIADPFEPGARLYKSGDLGRFLPDGNIEYHGRADGQIKVNGVRVETAEIEAALGRHPRIKEAAVAIREVNGEKQLMACFVPQSGQVISSRDLRDHLRQTLPAAVLPSAFLPLETLPLTPNGKVDRLALARLEPPTELDEDFSAAVATPQTPLQLQLQLVFERFFKQRPIGIDVGFFELGGDSLRAVALRVELEKALGRTLSPNVIYQAPTIEKLAAALERDNDEHWSSLTPLQPLGTKPPLFLIHTTPGDVLGYSSLIYHLGPDQPCYGLQSLAFHKPGAAHTTIEAMAEYYLSHVRDTQPRGPYRLAGWCYGGTVAAEMARQLLESGEKVAFLGLIETPAAPPARGRVGAFWRKLECLARMGPEGWRVYFREKLKYHAGGREPGEMSFERLEMKEGLDPKFVEERNRYLERLELVYATNMQAYRRYRTPRYPGHITLFNAAESDPVLIRDPLFGWKRLAGSLETHVIPGNHATILQGAQARFLAQAMADCLRRSESASTP